MPLDRSSRPTLLAAAFVAFISWALLTDWLPGLRWVPHAFVAGAIAAVVGGLYVVGTTSRDGRVYGLGKRRGEGRESKDETKDGQARRTGESRKDERRRALAAGRVPGGFGWLSKDAWEEHKAGLKGREEYRRPTMFPEARKFSRAVDSLLELILRDFVTSWYAAISPRATFRNEIERCIRSVLLSFAARLTGVDIVEVGVSKLLPLITAHLRDFYEAERAVRGKDLSYAVTESEELDMAIAAKYRGGKLHSAAALGYADTGVSQQAHVRALVKKLLPVLLPSNMQSSRAVTVLVQELVTCAVLGPVLRMLEDPDTWNRLIVDVGGPMLRDRKSVRKLRAALDQHAPVSPGKGKGGRGGGRPTQFPRLRPYDGERQFERFVRAIRNAGTLSDARRFRSEIVSQLRRDAAVENQDAAYLRRLETGKRLLDQKIASLSAADGSAKPNLTVQTGEGEGDVSARKRHVTLRELLYDASGLSYFMEYMDRSRLMRLVQFWLVVDGFRDPLENDSDEPPPGVADDPARMDIAQMYEGYLTRPELQTSELALQAARYFTKAGAKATAHDYIAARRAVLQTQTEVYERMVKEQFGGFKKSDLYYKWLAIDDNPAFSALKHKQTGASPVSASSVLPPPDSPPARDRSPVKPPRPQKLAVNKEPELRRAVLSTTDLKSATKTAFPVPEVRRSLDDTAVRPALFDDDVEDERLTQSVSSLRSTESDAEAAQQASREEAQAVSAMQLALDDLVADDGDKESVHSESNSRRSVDIFDPKVASLAAEEKRPPLWTQASGKGKPSIASLGLVGAPSNRGVFVDDLFGEEAEKFAEDEREDSSAHSPTSETETIHSAAPGDLGLTEAITALSRDITRLAAQRNILASLTAKAELTNNVAELRILRKSESSLQREIRRKELQRAQYAAQEGDNSLYGRAAVSIKSPVNVGREADGHEFALYVVEVRRQAGENLPAATWVVTRRYSQFHELHKRLRARFPAVRDLEFPRRQALFSLQKEFLERRRVALERWLRALLLVPAICRSRELRAFLSKSAIAGTEGGESVDARDFVSRIYNSVSDGMEDFWGNIPVLDQLSVAGQNLISAAGAQIGAPGIPNAAVPSAGNAGEQATLTALDPAAQDPSTSAEARAELEAYDGSSPPTAPLPAREEPQPFVKPITDLFLETFELTHNASTNSWLRGRTAVLILHQLLGGTIERRVREFAANCFKDDSLVSYIDLLKGSMWVNNGEDGLKKGGVGRGKAERERGRREAGVVLGSLVPDLAGSVVGRGNARQAGRKVGAVVGNGRLNTHLVLTLLDAVVEVVFPEIQDEK